MTAEPRPGSGTPDADDGHTINVGPVTVADPGSGTPDPTPNGQTWVCRNGRPTARCVEDCPVAAGCGPVPPAPSSDTPSDERLCGHCAASNDPSPAHRYIVGRVARQCPGRPAPSPVPEASERPDTAEMRDAARVFYASQGEHCANLLNAAADWIDAHPAPSSSPVGGRGLDVEQARPGTVPGSAADLNGHLASLIADGDLRVRVVLAVDAWLERCDARAAADREERTDV